MKWIANYVNWDGKYRDVSFETKTPDPLEILNAIIPLVRPYQILTIDEIIEDEDEAESYDRAAKEFEDSKK